MDWKKVYMLESSARKLTELMVPGLEAKVTGDKIELECSVDKDATFTFYKKMTYDEADVLIESLLEIRGNEIYKGRKKD